LETLEQHCGDRPSRDGQSFGHRDRGRFGPDIPSASQTGRPPKSALAGPFAPISAVTELRSTQKVGALVKSHFSGATRRDVHERRAPGQAMRGRREALATELWELTENKAARSVPAAVNGVRGGGERAPTRSPQTHIPSGHPGLPVRGSSPRTPATAALGASSCRARRRTAAKIRPLSSVTTSKEQL
jgi:hypothetical protein